MTPADPAPRVAELVAALEKCNAALHDIRGWYLEDMPAEGWEVMRERDRKKIEDAMTVARAALSSDGSKAAAVLKAAEVWSAQDIYDIPRARENADALRDAIRAWKETHAV